MVLACLTALLSACGGAQQRAPARAPNRPAPPPRHPLLAAAHTGIEACDAQTARIVGIWTPAQVQAIRARLERAAPSHGAATAEALRPLLDAHAERWARKSARVCSLHLGSKAIGKSEYTRRKACYDDALGMLSRYLGWLAQADPTVAERAFDGLWEIEARLPRCELEAFFASYSSEGRMLAVWRALASTRVALAVGRPAEAAQALADAERTGSGVELFRPALMTLRGRLLVARGELDDGETVLGHALELHAQHRSAEGLAETHAALAELLSRTGRKKEGLWHAQQALGFSRSVHGDGGAATLSHLLGLSRAARASGSAGLAARAAHDALALARDALGEAHPITLEALRERALGALSAGDPRAALSWLQRAVDGRVRLSGSQHPALGDDLLLAARIRVELGDPAKALTLYQSAAHIHNLAHGTQHPKVVAALHGAADMFRRLGRHRDAARDYEQVLRLTRALGDAPRPALARAYKDAAVALIEAGKPPQRALGYLQEAHALDEHLLGPEHVQLAIDLHLFGRYHAARGEHELAYDYHLRAVERLTELLGPDDRRVKSANAMLKRTLAAMGAVQ